MKHNLLFVVQIRTAELWSRPEVKLIVGSIVVIGVIAITLVVSIDHGVIPDPLGAGRRPGWECNNQLGSVCVRDVKTNQQDKHK
jgi:hypothetical protein